MGWGVTFVSTINNAWNQHLDPYVQLTQFYINLNRKEDMNPLTFVMGHYFHLKTQRAEVIVTGTLIFQQ